MNIIGVADGVSNLFPKKVTVMLVHAVNGETIGAHKMDSAALPENFNKPTVLEMNGTSWRIVKAFVAKENSYLRGKKLVLHVQERNEFIQGDKYMVPTRVSSLPAVVNDCLFNDFTISVSADDWGQLQFFSNDHAPAIQEDINSIASILSPPDALLGYDELHIREHNEKYQLDIPFDECCAFLNPAEKGNLSLNGGFIENGFALRTDSFTYYGVVENNIIKQLALQTFDCADDEFMSILSSYGLVLVDWCNADIFSIDG